MKKVKKLWSYVMNTKMSFTMRINHSPLRMKLSIRQRTYFIKRYRYPIIHKPETDELINIMWEQNIIQPSSSPWNSPVWIVLKTLDASGQQKWRIVIDYRRINEKTIHDNYPLPNITDLLDNLGRCHYFTTLDFASG